MEIEFLYEMIVDEDQCVVHCTKAQKPRRVIFNELYLVVSVGPLCVKVPARKGIRTFVDHRGIVDDYLENYCERHLCF